MSVSKRKRRWSRAFKLAAVARMEAAETITGLAEELGIRREMLHKWRRALASGGAEALPPIGRPANRVPDATSAPSAGSSAGQPLIEELQRKIGQQQLDLDFFRAALRHVREQRPPTGVPGETASTR
jgi:transposase